MPVYGVEDPTKLAKPQAPPSWGYVPTSWSTATPTSGLCDVSLVSQDSYGSYPAAFTQAAPYNPYAYGGDKGDTELTKYKDPAEKTKEKMAKMKKKDKKKRQKRRDAKSAAECLLFLGVFNMLMWTIPVLGTGWHQRMFTGFGVGFTRIKTSLFSIEIITECHVMPWPFGINSEKFAQMDPFHQACKVFQHMNGTHSLGQAKDLACVFSTHACYLMETLWYASFFLVFAFAVSALLSFIASMFLYYYWYNEHLAVIRKWSMALFMVSPLLGLLAFLMYCLLIPDIGELPRSWTALVSTINMNSGFGEIKSIPENAGIWVRYGWSWYFCWITILFSISAPVVWGYFFKKHPDEAKHEMSALEEKIAIEDAIQDAEEEKDVIEYGPSAADYPGVSSDPYAVYPQAAAYSQGAYPQAPASQGAYGYNPYGGYPQQAQPYSGY